ncbi:MAG: alpha/beta fold hydrolase [Terracidiphilus sp.]
MIVASANDLPEAPAPAPALRTVSLAGPAGRLEAVVNEGAAEARYAALVCHPHPLGGGNLHNRVVYHAMKALNAPEWGLALPVLRFNFRGTGLSQGAHDGEAEAADVEAALEWLRRAYGLPMVAAGFSFGAAMALKACCGQTDVRALALLGLPTQAAGSQFEYPLLGQCTIPKLFLSGDCDTFAPEAQLAEVAAAAAEPKRLVLLPRADHFFTGHLERMQVELSGWLKERLT